MFVDGVDFVDGLAELGQGAAHGLHFAPGLQFGLLQQAQPARQVMDHLLPAGLKLDLAPACFLQQADAAGQVLQHFVAAGLKFDLTPPQLLQPRPFALQLLLRPLQFRQLDLLLADQRLDFLARGRTVGRRGTGGGRGARGGRGGRLKVAVNKLSGILMSGHNHKWLLLYR